MFKFEIKSVIKDSNKNIKKNFVFLNYLILNEKICKSITVKKKKFKIVLIKSPFHYKVSKQILYYRYNLFILKINLNINYYSQKIFFNNFFFFLKNINSTNKLIVDYKKLLC